MGYIRGLVHGAVIGTVVGLCVAPQTGRKTRDQLSTFGRAAKDGYGVAERTIRRVTPMMAPMVTKLRHTAEDEDLEDDDDFVGVETTTVRIHDHTNGHGQSRN